MAKTPNEWQHWVRTYCTHAGLNERDADECVSEVLLRYRHRRGTYPWEEPAPDEKLLRLLVQNVICEYKRTCARRQHLEREYCALQQALFAATETPEQQAVSNAAAEQFRAQLPCYLRQTLELLEAGYTPAEIAQQLGVCVSTVYTYRRELKAHFIRFFGYDPRISGVRVVNYSGSARMGFQTDCEEVSDETAEDTGGYSVGVSDCEPGGDAPHLGSAERVQRGGGRTCLRR
jgi:DNA-directed RNA polymerase specialized sigma24 family protein